MLQNVHKPTEALISTYFGKNIDIQTNIGHHILHIGHISLYS